jgi:hypothetical protein
MLVFKGTRDRGYVKRMHKSRQNNHYADTNIPSPVKAYTYFYMNYLIYNAIYINVMA